MSYSELKKQFDTGSYGGVYVLVGDEPYLSQKAEAGFKSLVNPDDQAMDWLVFDLEQTPIETVLAELATASFCGGRRVIYGKQALFLTGQKSKQTHDTNALLAYLEHIDQQNILVLEVPAEKLDSRKKIVKALQQKAQVVELNNLEPQELQRYVQQTLQNAGYGIDSDALEELLKRSGGQLTTTMDNLKKLMLYAINEKQITRESVETLIEPVLTDTAFDLVDYVMGRRVAKAISSYHGLIDAGEPPLGLNALLLSQFRLLLQIEGSQENDTQLGKTLGVHPYRIKKSRELLRKYQHETLSQGYQKIAQLEMQLKRSNQSPVLLFELMMTSL